MMKKIITLYFVCLILVACKVTPKLDLDNSGPFYKMIGGDLNESVYDVVQTPDEGFLVAGSTTIILPGNIQPKETAYIAKLDRLGNIIWKQRYPARAARAIAQSPTGGWFVGMDSTVGATAYKMTLFKIDDNGGVQWAKFLPSNAIIPNNRYEQVKSISVNASKSKVYLVGDYRPDVLTLTDITMQLVTTDLDGNVVDIPKEYGTVNPLTPQLQGPNEVGSVSIDANIPEGDLMFCGTGSSQGITKNDIRVALFNETILSPIFAKEFGTNNDDFGEQIVNTRDGNVIVVGSTNPGPNGGADIYVSKINIFRNDPNGKWNDAKTAWEKTFGGDKDDFGKSVYATRDGGYLVLSTLSTQNNSTDIYLIKLDAFGGLLWEKTFGGVRADQARRVTELANGDILVLGTISLENNTMIALIKTNNLGVLVR